MLQYTYRDFNLNYFIKKDDADGLAFNNTVAQLTSTATLNNKVATYISIINNAMTTALSRVTDAITFSGSVTFSA